MHSNDFPSVPTTTHEPAPPLLSYIQFDPATCRPRILYAAVATWDFITETALYRRSVVAFDHIVVLASITYLVTSIGCNRVSRSLFSFKPFRSLTTIVPISPFNSLIVAGLGNIVTSPLGTRFDSPRPLHEICSLLGSLAAAAILAARRDDSSLEREGDAHRHLHTSTAIRWGTCTLLLCLITMLITGAYGVAASRVAFPFAIAKLVFDLAWDYFDFRTKRKGLWHKLKGVSQESTHTASTYERSEGNEDGSEMTLATLTKQPAVGGCSIGGVRMSTEGIADPFQPRTASSNAAENEVEKSYKHPFLTLTTTIRTFPVVTSIFAFLQTLSVQFLIQRGYIGHFSSLLMKITWGGNIYAMTWFTGLFSLLSNLSGVGIGNDVLLAQIIHEPCVPTDAQQAAWNALIVVNTVIAVNFAWLSDRTSSACDIIWKRHEFRDFFQLAALMGIGLTLLSIQFTMVSYN